MLERVINIEQTEMVTIHMGKSRLGFVCSFLRIIRTAKTIQVQKLLRLSNRSNRRNGFGTESIAVMDKISFEQLYSQLAINICARCADIRQMNFAN